MAWELRDGRWIGTESGTGKRMIVIEKLLVSIKKYVNTLFLDILKLAVFKFVFKNK